MLSKDYIIAIKNNNNLLELIKIDINKPQTLISELKAMTENPNRTIYDIQCHFFANYNCNPNISHNICYPAEYNQSYVNKKFPPKIKSLTEIQNHWSYMYNYFKEQEKHRIIDQEVSRIKGIIHPKYFDYEFAYEIAEKKAYYKTREIEAVAKENLKEYKIKEKEQIFIEYETWITINETYTTTLNITNTNNILMYSSENIGWTNFNYNINNDFKIFIRTNFGYGNASYFNLTVKYKDLVVIPYSFLVKYRYANAYDFIGYTRKYEVKRSSWELVFNFVVDTVNKAQDNPENFIKEFIIGEIKEMMSGLEHIVFDAKKSFHDIDDNKDNATFRFTEKKSTSEKLEAINKNTDEKNWAEALFLWQVYKITQGLCFLDSLRNILLTFAEFEEYINECIDTLLSYNTKIYPEVKELNNKNETRINLDEKELKEKEKKENKLNSKLEPHNKELNRIIKQYNETIKQYYKQSIKTIEELEDDYEKNNPEYKDLKKELEDTQNYIAQLKSRIKSYKDIKEILNESMELIESVCKVE